MSRSIEWPRIPKPQRRQRIPLIILLVVLAVILLGGRTALSYYIDALWFGSLGYADVFWKSLRLQSVVFSVFAGLSFVILYGSFLLMKRAYLQHLPSGHTIYIGDQAVKLPVDSILRLLAVGGSLVVAFIAGAAMMVEWPAIALYWYAPRSVGGSVDPIFGRPLNFYLFSLPVWQLVSGWLLALAVLASLLAVFFIVITGGARALGGSQGIYIPVPWRGLSIAFAFLLLTLAMRTYLGRFEQLFEDHTIFTGVAYADAHVMLPGLLVVTIALLLGAVMAGVNAAMVMPRVRWLVASIVPAAVCFFALQFIAWYVTSFIVKPNELVRERPYIAHNIEMTRKAYGLDRVSAARVSGGNNGGSHRPGPQPGDAAEHPPVGLARAAGHAAADPGNPHLLRLSGHRHRSLRNRRDDAAGDARRARVERRQAARKQPQLDQREADLHPRLRHHDEPGERLHPGRAADADAEQHAGAEHGARAVGDASGNLLRRADQHATCT